MSSHKTQYLFRLCFDFINSNFYYIFADFRLFFVICRPLNPSKMNFEKGYTHYTYYNVNDLLLRLFILERNYWFI
jgi:hypothetical protein